MKILYKNKGLKKYLKKLYLLNDIENTIDFFQRKFGKKVIVNEMVINANKGYSLILETPNKNNVRIDILKPSKNVFSEEAYNVTLQYNEWLLEKYQIFTNSTGYKVYEEYQKGEIRLRKGCEMVVNGIKKISYTVYIDDKKLYLTTCGDEDLLNTLLELDKISLSDVYHKLENKKKKYVDNITISVEDINETYKEELVTNEGSLCRYTKSYVQNNTKVMLSYDGNYINVKTEQKIDSKRVYNPLTVDVEKEMVKVKKLFK